MSHSLAVLVFCVTCGVALRLNAADGPTTLPEQIASALSEAGAKLAPIQLSCIMERETSLSPDEAAKLNIPELPPELPHRSEQRITLQDGCIRTWEKDLKYESITEMTCDGTTYCFGTTPITPMQAILRKELLVNLASMDDAQACPSAAYFEAIGTPVSNGADDLLNKRQPISIVLRLLAGNSELTEVQSVKANGTDLIRVVIVGENLDRKRAEAVDLVAAERTLRAETDFTQKTIQIRLNAIKQFRQLPPRSVYTFLLERVMHFR